MADRFQRVFQLDSGYYLEGSPVMIEAGALLKDAVDGRMLAQIKLCNLSEHSIIHCKVAIRAFEVNGIEAEGIAAFPYEDLDIKTGMDFGAKTPIYLPDQNTRRMSVSVVEVVYENGIVWRAEPCEWEPVPVQETIEDHFEDAELGRQFLLEAGQDSRFVPLISKGLFHCTCPIRTPLPL